MGTRDYFDKEVTLDFIRMKLGDSVSSQMEGAGSKSNEFFPIEIEALERHFDALFFEGFERVFREKVNPFPSKDFNLTDASIWFITGQDNDLIYKYFEYFIEQDDQEWVDIELYALAERDWQAARGIRPESTTGKSGKSGVTERVLAQTEVDEFTGSALASLTGTEETIRSLKNDLSSFREEVGSSDRMSALKKLRKIGHQLREIARQAEYGHYRADEVERLVVKRIETEGFESVNELNPFARRRYDYHWKCLDNLSIGMANIFE